MAKYNYQWQTIEEILNNKDNKVTFRGWRETTLREISDDATDKDFQNAHNLWLKLKDEFNKEAIDYDSEACDSLLGSVGDLEEREVLRSDWWRLLEGNQYGDYRTITRIIEVLHDGEKLEAGIIYFGS